MFFLEELIGWNSRGTIWCPSEENFRGSGNPILIPPENCKSMDAPSPGGQVILEGMTHRENTLNWEYILENLSFF